MSETWKPVLGYEDTYEVSNCGQVRRTLNRFGNWSGRLCRHSSVRGYLRYTLCQNTETRTVSAHRMVWEAFIGPISEGMQINHKNGVKDDNRLENLEVCTPSENTRHAFRVLGRSPVKNPRPGSENGRATLTEADIPAIRLRIAGGELDDAIARDYGVNGATVWQIRKGNTWRHVK